MGEKSRRGVVGEEGSKVRWWWVIFFFVCVVVFFFLRSPAISLWFTTFG